MKNRWQGISVAVLAVLGLVLVPTPDAGAQAAGSVSGVCDDLEVTKAKALFVRMRELRKADPDAVPMEAFRAAAAHYVSLAEACYEARYGAAAKEPTRIDDGGVLMDSEPSADFNTNGRKWGAGSPFSGGSFVPGPGLPGGTVTWSYMPDGVNMGAEPASPNVAIQSLPTFQPCFETEIQDAFDAWSAVADIQFTRVADNAFPFNAAGARGDIRVGAHVFDGPGGTLAHGFFPPPNGVSAAGDIHFDAAENWDCVDTGPQFDIGIVMTHELGHAIGLNHQNSPPTALMNPFYNPSILIPLADDIAGASSIYGTGGASCTLDLTLTYDGTNVRLDFLVGASGPTTFNAWLTIGNAVARLWSLPLPAISPPLPLPVTFPLPSFGTIGVLTTLTTPGDGIVCSAFRTVDTGP